MNLFGSAEFKVGLMVLVVAGLIAFMTLSTSEDPGLFNRKAKYHWFILNDASGVVKNSIVKSAGIKIGMIKDIKLAGDKARVDVVLNQDIVLTTSARVQVKSTGILGDKYIDIYLGDLKDPELKSGESILNIEDKGSLDKVMANVSEVSHSLKEIADVLKAALTGKGNTDTTVGQTLKNLEILSSDLREFTQANKKDMGQVISNLKDITDNFKKFTDSESEDGFQKNWKKMSDSLARVDKILTNVDEITSKINRGEGTIGKLVNDEKTAVELNNAIEGVNDFLGSANRMQTSIDLHSEFLAEQSMTKSYFGVRLQPNFDRYYEIQVVNDPKGVVSRKSTTETSGGSSTTTDQTVIYKDQVKFTALFAKNFYDLTIKGGLMENSAGVGAEYKFLRRKLSVSMDAFNLSNSPPHLRANVRYNIAHGFYLTGGADDFINQSLYSTFIGAGLDINNDDIAMLLSKVP